MASLLFKLNNVPDDEADEVRALLDHAEIEFYETSSGNWGLSFAAIWLVNEQQLELARQLIDDYQQQRFQTAAKHRQDLKLAGQHTTHWQAFKQSPVKIPAVIIFVLAILYFSIAPFFPA